MIYDPLLPKVPLSTLLTLSNNQTYPKFPFPLKANFDFHMLLGHETFGQSNIKITIVCIKDITIYFIVILIYIRQYTLHNCICCKFWINRLSKFHLVQFTPDKPQLPMGPIIAWIRGFEFLTVAKT